jgi:predicted phage tail protein
MATWSDIKRFDINLDVKSVSTSAQDQTPQRTDVAIVPTPSQSDMAIRGSNIIGGVHIKPSFLTTICGNPGMGCVCSHHARLAWWWISPQIAAHITSCHID